MISQATDLQDAKDLTIAFTREPIGYDPLCV